MTTEVMNGQIPPETIAALEEQLTAGYKPSIPLESMYSFNGMPMFWLPLDIEAMLTHPAVRQALNYFKGGIAGAEFWGGPHPDNAEDEKGLPICPDNPNVGRFVKEQLERLWDRAVPHLQTSYEHGWIGSEQVYEDDAGVMKWDCLHTFSPRDTYLLTQDFHPVGIRIKNVQNSNAIDLWMAGENVPAKGLWYAHQPRYNNYYGQSQLFAAWRPWRRLASKDALETVIDGALYRLGYQGPIARFPDEDLIGPAGTPNTTLDSQGRPRRYARDVMRQIAEQYKAGGSVALPSKRDPVHGEYLYALDIPTSTLTGISELIDAAKDLRDQITQGIGVPPELLQAEESGSGYSGRRIPLESFLSNQQQIADAFLRLFVDQIIRPLVRWNFGDVRFNVQVKSLIKTRTKAAAAGNPQQQNPQPGQPMQRAEPPVQPQQHPQPMQQPPQQAAFSHSLVTDRIRTIAQRILRQVA